VQNAKFLDNGGVGLWCDITCKTATFRGNRAERNLNNGIEWEFSPGPFVIDSNTPAGNRGCGILVWLREYAPTAAGRVTNNVISGNTGGICTNGENQPGVVYANNAGG
jgi:hypothetical protein